MNKRELNKELEVDFIGGEELTKEEESELSKFFSKKKELARNRQLAIRRKKQGNLQIRTLAITLA